jgi:L-ascorbate metabolism protein UlaG (beta-lactamase superfamily)
VTLELWWLGQAGFRLRDDSRGVTVFCDPFLSQRDDRTWQSPIDAAGLAREADVILVSHEHADHFDQPTLRAAAGGSHFTLVVPTPIRQNAIDLGIPEQRVVGAQPDQIVEPTSGVRVHAVPARHGVNVADAYNFGEDLSNGLVRYLGYVVEIGGVRVYHSGDCSPYPGQINRLRALRPDIALLPINGRDFFRESEDNIVGNMDYREAARIAHDSGARVLIPMHWELFPGNRGFPRDLVAFVNDHYPNLSVLVMGRGARLTLQPVAG